jgi:hypothetical protein
MIFTLLFLFDLLFICISVSLRQSLYAAQAGLELTMYVAQAGLNVATLLSPPPKCMHYHA